VCAYAGREISAAKQFDIWAVTSLTDGGTSARLPIRRSGGAINEAIKMQLKLPGDHQPCVKVQAKEERKNRK